MLFTDAQFAIALTFLLFAFFFVLGYRSDKKSGGFFMIFSGFIFLAFETLCIDLFSSNLIALLTPFAIFIILLGIMKAFYTKETKEGNG